MRSILRKCQQWAFPVNLTQSEPGGPHGLLGKLPRMPHLTVCIEVHPILLWRFRA